MMFVSLSHGEKKKFVERQSMAGRMVLQSSETWVGSTFYIYNTSGEALNLMVPDEVSAITSRFQVVERRKEGRRQRKDKSLS